MSSSSGDESLRERVVQFYRTRVPHKLVDVDAVLLRWKGCEDLLLPALEEKYPLPSEESKFEWRLFRFFSVYEPLKVKTVRELAARWKSRERELMSILETLYGPEPCDMTGGGHRSRLHRFCRHYRPALAHPPDELLKMWAGKEEQLLEFLSSLYGPEPSIAEYVPDITSTTRGRLVRFFETYHPARLSAVDHLLDVWQGKEEDMFRYLKKLYGTDSEPQKSLTLPVRPLSNNEARARLDILMQEHAPERIQEMNSILEAWQGRESEMIEFLQTLYGLKSYQSPPRAAQPSDVKNDVNSHT